MMSNAVITGQRGAAGLSQAVREAAADAVRRTPPNGDASDGDRDDRDDEPNDLAADTSYGRPDAPFRTLIYGPEGVGKSTFCSRCPGVYFLPTEEGVNEIPVPQYKTRISSLALLYQILAKLRDKRHPYKAVCLDNAGETEKLMVAAVEARTKKTIADLNDDFGKGYEAVADEWRRLVSFLDDLRDRRNMNVLFTAHSKRETVKNLEGKDYDRDSIDLFGKRGVKVLTGWCEHVLYARQDVRVAPENKHKVLAVKGELSLYTRGTAAWAAKTRGQVAWPDRIPLDWDTFARLREVISRHGAALPGWLRGRFEAVEESIAPESRGKARDVFEKNLDAGQWHMADAVCRQAEEESGASADAAGEGTAEL
jgi:hypothetical protein